MTTKTKLEKLTEVQKDLYDYLSRTRGKFFNEMCRELEGTLSRRTIAKSLIVLEKKGFVTSNLINSNFSERGLSIHRWVRKYKVVKN